MQEILKDLFLEPLQTFINTLEEITPNPESPNFCIFVCISIFILFFSIFVLYRILLKIRNSKLHTDESILESIVFGLCNLIVWFVEKYENIREFISNFISRWR